MLSLQINGQPRELEVDMPASLQAVLDHLGIKPDRVAVELNEEIVARKSWGMIVLKNGDRLEIVHFVGGGAVWLDREARIGLRRACCSFTI
jgi:sulfur carrier protein